MKRKSNYTGPLAEPFPPVSLLRGDGEARRGELLKEKMRLLFQHYRIEVSAPNSWSQLCLALAEEHVPGFSERTTRRSGPADKWTPHWRERLYDDVHNLGRQGYLPEKACRDLARKPDYKRFGKHPYPPTGKTLLRIFRDEERRRRLKEKYLGPTHAFGFIGLHVPVLESGEPSPLYQPNSKEVKK